MKAKVKEDLQRIADKFGLGANTKNIANEAYWRMIALGYKVYMINEKMYVSLIELDPVKMIRYELETGCYGELYKYDYYCKHDPGMAARIRSINPNKEKKKPRLV